MTPPPSAAQRTDAQTGPRQPRIRTFHARHGRVTPAMRRTLDEVGPLHALALRVDERPLVLEVGCGHGDAALAFAEANPGLDVLAVDVHTPGIARLLRALDDRPRPNVWVERTDAVALLDERIGPSTLHGVHVFFPDPWPKARHHKRRFVRPDVIDLLADRMRPGAELLVATDVHGYATAAADVLDAHPAFRGGVTPRPPWRPGSGYEARARTEGRSVVDLAYRRA